jgi:hypothetical protein
MPRRIPRPPSTSFGVSVPVELNNRLIKAATANGVSLSAEVAGRLARSFDHEGEES